MSIPKTTGRDANSFRVGVSSGVSGTERYVMTTQQDEGEKQSHLFSFTKDQEEGTQENSLSNVDEDDRYLDTGKE
jgi:hypothetical protein